MPADIDYRVAWSYQTSKPPDRRLLAPATVKPIAAMLERIERESVHRMVVPDAYIARIQSAKQRQQDAPEAAIDREAFGQSRDHGGAMRAARRPISGHVHSVANASGRSDRVTISPSGSAS